MKCSFLIAVFLNLFFSKNWCYGLSSYIQINDSSVSRLPSLYELEPWPRCQEAGDLYCLVDAVLTPHDLYSTTVIEALKNYSSVTLKHFNRTLIHRGVCVTRCEGYNVTRDNATQPPAPALQRCIGDSILQDYGLQTEVLSVGWCKETQQRSRTTSDEDRAFFIFTLILIGLTGIATVIHIVAEKWTKLKVTKYILAFSLKKNWSILTYDRSKPLTDDRMADVSCMEGIRFVAIQFVILAHVIFVYMYSYTDNPEYIEHMFDANGWQEMMNSLLWVQAFFSLSAFLTAYSLLIYVEKKKFTIITFLMSIANRWVRLTPAAVVALWFTITWFPRLGAGPNWSWLVEREAVECRERWLYHVIYVHNHLPLGKFCMGHTWYLAVDMQLHIVGMVVLALCLRFRRATWPVLGFLLICSAVATGAVVYYYQLTPLITAQAPESLRNMFAGSKLLSLLYLPSYMNGAGYVCGLITAFLLYTIQKNGSKLNQNKWFLTIFHLSLVCASLVVVCGSVFLGAAPPAASAPALYSALDRTLVAVFFNIFLLGCFIQCKSHLKSMLEWHGFHVLGRLSYCAFLFHFMVLRVLVGSNTQLAHMSILSCISLLITTSTITYTISVPICLLVEIPALQLWKAATTRAPARPGAPAPAPAPAPSPRAPPRPFDLVSQLRKGDAPVV